MMTYDDTYEARRKIITDQQKTETRSLILTLKRHGLTPFKATYGEGMDDPSEDVTTDKSEFVDHLMACGHGYLFVQDSEGVKTWIHVIYGNNPGELMADYGCPTGQIEFNQAMDNVCGEHNARWDK